MARKPRSTRLDFTIYLVVRLVVCMVQSLPLSIALALSDCFARLAYQIDRRHRDVARDNLHHAFPELRQKPAACADLIRRTFRHFFRVVVEIIHAPRLFHVHRWHKTVELINPRAMLDRLTADRPLLIVTAHFGNWEIAGYILGLFHFRTYAIARTLDNPYLERYFKRFRQATGQTILAKKGDFDQILEILRSRGAIATLGDQDAGPKGLFVDFFGRPASTHKAVALMALEQDVPLLVVGVPRVAEPTQYQIVVVDEIDPRDYDDDPNAVRTITQRYTHALEQLIRRYPEQYFWLHRRWKHQPRSRQRQAA